jgi:hypothetical protein
LEKSTNVPPDKINSFTTALDNLYAFSSEFHHLVDQYGRVNPMPNVNQEDAFHLYAYAIYYPIIDKEVGSCEKEFLATINHYPDLQI